MVRPEDDWLGVADRFGIDPAELRRQNPEIARLFPGRLLFIPDPRNDANGIPLLRTPAPVSMGTPTPTCYETGQSGILCLGVVRNTQAEAVERVIVRVDLLDQSGVPTASREVVVPQRAIPPGSDAPYHALFAAPGPVDAYSGVLTTLLRAESAPSDALVQLGVNIATSELDGDRYVVRGQVKNDARAPVRDVQVVVTVYDEVGRVAGYRVMDGDGLAVGETLSVRMDLLPQVFSANLRHTTYAGGWLYEP
jgi:hypothetical protein